MTVLTEDEARTQTCIGPVGCGQLINQMFEVFYDPNYGMQRTRPILGTGTRLCIGSDCKMAWRRVYPSGSDDWEGPRGYCGIAGKP